MQLRKIKTYSAGMVQRLRWAQALINEPELVIMDEPTANLDPFGKMEFIEKIADWRKRGINFLISSHILPELEKICDKVIVINEGRILDYGPVSELKLRYRSYDYKVYARQERELERFLSMLGCVKRIKKVEKGFLVAVEDNDAFLQSLMIVASSGKFKIEVLHPYLPH